MNQLYRGITLNIAKKARSSHRETGFLLVGGEKDLNLCPPGIVCI